jgi:two-component system chemotaxis response regulator CheY
MFSQDSHFLIVDDSHAVRSLVRQQLTSLGFRNIVDAENGKEALEKMEGLDQVGVHIHLVIGDWNMPEMNGIELLGNMKKNPKFKNIPFLMITSESETDNVVKAIVLGVSDFVVKPFDQQILAEKLTAVWKRANQK